MKPTIALSRRLPQQVVDALSPHGSLRMPKDDASLSASALAELLAPADAALVTALDRIDAALLDACPRLKSICSIGIGTDHIDLSAAAARGITVTNTPGVLNDAVADLAFGLMLAAARRLPLADAYVRSGQWTPAQISAFGMGQDVSRKTLGIVGFGRIGQALARRARGFDMPVLYHARHAVDHAIEHALAAQHRTLDALLQQSDYVVLLLPLTPETRHLIAAPQLALMKPSAVFVNVARGGIVDDAALARALRDGELAAAALDCVENEPHVHPDLVALPQVVLSPHIGSATPGTRQAMVGMALQNLMALLSGQAAPNPVQSSPAIS